MSVDMVKAFDIWFGAIFLACGIVAMLGAVGMWLAFKRRPPRQPKAGLFLLIPLGLAVPFGLVGGYFMMTGLAAQQLEERLLHTGVSTQARVVEVEQTYTRLNGRYLWRVRYEYRDPTGRVHEGASGYLERADATSYRVGDQAFVRYDPQQPSASIWLGRENRATMPGGAPASG